MEPAIWICIFLPLFIALIEQERANKRQQFLRVMKLHKKKGGIDMGEAIKRFIGKECIITAMNEPVIGIIDAVDDNWVVISPIKGKSGGTEIICIDYISRIRERPKKKDK